MPSKAPLPFPNADKQALGPDISERGALFHRLNNQLGIILANAELLESKLGSDDGRRARAAQIVATAIDAISTAQDIRAHTAPPTE